MQPDTIITSTEQPSLVIPSTIEHPLMSCDSGSLTVADNDECVVNPTPQTEYDDLTQYGLWTTCM